jgi:predicted DNA-binding transcriptional regulator AlpA
MAESEVLFYGDVAEMLRRTPNTIRRDVMRGTIPHHKPYGPRGRVVFFRDEIEAWLRGKTVEPVAGRAS